MRLLALVLAGAGLCLATLWVTLDAGVWLALQGVDVGLVLTRLVTGFAFVAMVGMLARAVALLVGTIRDPESGVQR